MLNAKLITERDEKIKLLEDQTETKNENIAL